MFSRNSKTSLVIVLTAIVTGILMLTGCSKKIVGNEKSNPIYIKAKAAKEAGKYQEAAEQLNALLLQAPDSPFLHKELAIVYADNLCEYYKAIYHFERHIELSRLDSEDSRTIHGFIADCKRKATLCMIQEDPTLTAGAGPQANATESNIQEMEMTLNFQRDQNAGLKQKCLDLQKQNQALLDELNTLKTQATAKVTAPVSAAVSATEGGIYTVKAGDTIARIATKIYGRNTEAYRKMILNENGLSNSNIKVGQKLKIPKLPQ